MLWRSSTILGSGIRATDRTIGSVGDPHLPGAREVTGYSVHASDGDVGHVEEFLVEDASWAIRDTVVDTGNWLPERKVPVSPRWFHGIDWVEQLSRVELGREQVKTSPECDPAAVMERAAEERLHMHHGVRPYWL